ncbi:alpha/beta hydrolase [Tessaracoccus sp. OS52]|uniref:alpha/beta fold hydrolase n=1 Tax=Tessaracoccus sp. OS52 TaxID=2886691 RepID=UPI001D108857|nr:alpha/beta hydrolase [Tessaracoccus sp. OS52]MCC2594257.1 alpha/beta hydrolase [Tessaracoccus sp. OS52]
MSRSIVLVHGSRTSGSQWDPQVQRLAARGWRCVAPDLPGHGDRRDEEFTAVAAVDAIRAALEASGEPAHLVGHSLGGMLAIHAAATHPGLVRTLTAACCSVQPSAHTAGFYGGLIRAADRLGERPVRRLLGADGAAWYLRKGRAGLDVVAASMRAVAAFDLLADLARIPAPVTILNARVDQLRLQERRFATVPARGRLVVLGYGTHMVNLTHPERFTTDLERVLSEADAVAATRG